MANNCKKCTSEVKSNHNGIACDLCSKWYHAKCVGITAEPYKFLKSCSVEESNDDNGAQSNVNGGVMWFCQDCMGPASQTIKKFSVVQKRQDEMEAQLRQNAKQMNMIELELKENKREVENQITDNKREITEIQKQILDINAQLQMVQEDVTMNNENVKWSDIVSQAVETKFETVSADINMVEKTLEETRVKAQEIRDKENRRNNIILYNVPESQPGSYEAVIKHDSDYFLDLCDKVFALDIAREDVKRVYRIGRRGPEARPLLIQLSSGMLKNNIMETTFKLQKVEDFKHLVITHDMTKLEREQCKKLVAEAKAQETQETSGEFIFRVRGPPGAMKIVKLKKRK